MTIEKTTRAFSFVRHMIDGRCIVVSVIPNHVLPEGVNDGIVETMLHFSDCKDVTKQGVGKSLSTILENGWTKEGLK